MHTSARRQGHNKPYEALNGSGTAAIDPMWTRMTRPPICGRKTQSKAHKMGFRIRIAVT
jgi:hypothetical protein